jgi:hypothetical protein
MGSKVENLSREVVTSHRYQWYCPLCLNDFNQHGGKKIGFIIALLKQHGVKKVGEQYVCGECATDTGCPK